jgi:high-affinity Fe2+/Pb2+ permease
MNPDDVERFLEHTYTPPIETKDLEKKLEEALNETDANLREQAIMGAMCAILGTVVLAWTPVLVAAGVTALVAKFGIVLAAAVLTVGGTAVLADAIDRLGDGD